MLAKLNKKIAPHTFETYGFTPAPRGDHINFSPIKAQFQLRCLLTEHLSESACRVKGAEKATFHIKKSLKINLFINFIAAAAPVVGGGTFTRRAAGITFWVPHLLLLLADAMFSPGKFTREKGYYGKRVAVL